ncbi:hypothetical protein P170DRAFT_473353 [Aspergillus steynii IBT 23096]|uniref:Zn(2)-C6 fungal-type domain-containing protein n=1 Tax=Aspergillus steynii IBT 23096 TaxID=1392250 RepID=A0A2I2GKT5_9EURO|nr:uncharacterized protein P170DRAFT_473353 [Aspergillus steynii IBT 23096]PLB53492.1 hypothetical protein P170DRAFT_473353 [Aspergillus steynii IBT 23096]
MTERRSAQVCDRCRIKRIKCDGRQPRCGKCERAGSECSVSVRLRRRTTPRGYVEPTDEVIQQLQQELEAARNQLQRAFARERELSATVASRNQEIEHLRELNGTSRDTSGLSGQANDPTSVPATGPVVGHLGRLVLGDDNAEFFAGSTTGVHFVLSAQQQYQVAFSSREHFPECMFRLHVLQPTHLRGTSSGNIIPDRTSDAATDFGSNSCEAECSHIRKLGANVIRGAFEKYIQNWGSLYPVLLAKQFFENLEEIMTGSSLLLDQYRAVPFIFQVYALMALDSAKSSRDSSLGSASLCPNPVDDNAVLSSLYGRMPCRGDLNSLQGLILYLLYLQTTSQHSLAIRVCGTAVRLAQSLGLHRHSRRFKHSPGEAELRKRLWWAVFALDIHACILYGLPRTIQLADTDTDLPINTDYDDLCCDQLSYPLPGETTNVEPFLHHVLLTQILSRCLEQMYTTTNRRGGVAKIHRLQREIEVWKQNVQSDLPGVALVKQRIQTKLDNINNNNSAILPAQHPDFSSLWLFMLGELAVMLIHRPALTFGPREPQFVDSLQSCVEAATHLISAFDIAREEYLITRLWPLGYHLIFQSGLTLLYDRWFQDLTRPPRAVTNVPNLAPLICLGIGLLSKHATILDERVELGATDASSVADAIRTLQQIASYLHRLFMQTVDKESLSLDHNQPIHNPTEALNPGFDSTIPGLGAVQSMEPSMDVPEYATSMWPPLSIDEINQMELFEFTDSLLIPWDS